MDESKIDFNALEQVIDTTWGRSSTPKTSSYSVKALILSADKMQVTFQTIINFRDERELVRAKRSYVDESVSVSNEAVKHIKSMYSDLTSSSLKTKELNSVDSIEVVGRRMAIYRRKTILEIS
jgi:hypothetical protein